MLQLLYLIVVGLTNLALGYAAVQWIKGRLAWPATGLPFGATKIPEDPPHNSSECSHGESAAAAAPRDPPAETAEPVTNDQPRQPEEGAATAIEDGDHESLPAAEIAIEDGEPALDESAEQAPTDGDPATAEPAPLVIPAEAAHAETAAEETVAEEQAAEEADAEYPMGTEETAAEAAGDAVNSDEPQPAPAVEELLDQLLLDVEAKSRVLEGHREALASPEIVRSTLEEAVEEIGTATQDLLKSLLRVGDEIPAEEEGGQAIVDNLEESWSDINNIVVGLVTMTVDGRELAEVQSTIDPLIGQLQASLHQVRERLSPSLGPAAEAAVMPVDAVNCPLDAVMAEIERETAAIQQLSSDLEELPGTAVELEKISERIGDSAQQVLKALMECVDEISNAGGDDEQVLEELEASWSDINDGFIQLVTVAISEEQTAGARAALLRICVQLAEACRQASERLAASSAGG